MTSKEEQGCQVILNFDKKMKKTFGINPSRKALMGLYGELLVINAFKKHKFLVKEKGNLAGCDLVVNGRKVEVRTSEIKNEWAFPKTVWAWGWKLQKRDGEKKLKDISYDYIVLVQLFKNWERYNLYLFSRKQIKQVSPTYFSGYQTVARVIYLFKTSLRKAIKADKHKMITAKCKEFNKTPSKYLIKWKKTQTQFKL